MTRLSSNEKGVGGSLVIIVIVVVLAVAGVITWQLTKKSPSSTPTSSSVSAKTASSAAVSSACLKQFNDNSLCAFAEHTNISSQQYVAMGTATSATGTKSTFTVKNDGKGNTEVIYGSNGQQLTSISLDGVTYIQSAPGGTWYEYSGSSLSSATSVPNPTSGFNLNFTTTTPAGVKVTKIGTASCGSLSCEEYKVVVASAPTATQYVYFDTSDYLLRQWASNEPGGVSVNLTFSYPAVTITKPSPVQQI
jgi:hypothetical protein